MLKNGVYFLRYDVLVTTMEYAKDLALGQGRARCEMYDAPTALYNPQSRIRDP